ncbi:uncharacterized protein BXIN_0628 [Babesia sp. Xinjiang]|uniref:uncharacterized protein n=1 Tax=Babesia sp. Xinjiang TaxID=462227 RepID=UPI000A23CB44|nr:uncharacterized protein BXIN_0628 [Babesia sp. Xinjiang]ORM41811.1 hypothetical protein BXIN_0628 [Babesia sp. Xinjiang]
MARILRSQSSTSTNDGDDFYSSCGSDKFKCSTGLTSAGCVSSYCHSPDTTYTTWQRHVDFGVEKVLSNVYDAICDLYNEDILPTLHEIRRKLRRNNAHLVDGTWLLRICNDDSYRRFQVVNLAEATNSQNDDGIQHTWAIMLAGKPFVQHETEPADPRDLAVVFRYAVFIASTQKLEREEPNEFCDHGLRYPNLTQIGGRYLFAEYLRKVGPSRFRRLPLGKVVRIVQDAIDLNILSYDGNNVVPSVSSTTTAKKMLAQLDVDKPSSTMRRETQIRTMKNNIIRLLKETPPKSNESPVSSLNHSKGRLTLKLSGSDNAIALCKLPIIYKKRFNQEIDFAAGGYSKLTDFLLNEVPECSVEPSMDCPKKGKSAERSKLFESVMEHVTCEWSTNVLFPLAMNSSRLSMSAATRLVTEW